MGRTGLFLIPDGGSMDFGLIVIMFLIVGIGSKVMWNYELESDCPSKGFAPEYTQSGEALEFVEQNPPESNPNLACDNYALGNEWGRKYEIIFAGVFGGISLLMLVLGNFNWKVLPCIIGFLIFVIYCLWDVWRTSKVGRSRIIAKGKAYPGVIVKEELYLSMIKKNYEPGHRVPRVERAITIRYAEGKSLVVEEIPYDYDPKILLENAYCTVYEYKKRRIAADFKVKERFINSKGKVIGDSNAYYHYKEVRKSLANAHARKKWR